MKIHLLIIFLLGILIVSCDKCDDKTKKFQAELYPAIRNTDYDWYWEKVFEVSDETIYFGIETGYYECEAYGAEELNSELPEFYTDREIVIGEDTIFSMTNLFKDDKWADCLILNKNETTSIYSRPQYILQLNNKTLKLHDYYTFYFKGYTVSGAEIYDSTIIYIK